MRRFLLLCLLLMTACGGREYEPVPPPDSGTPDSGEPEFPPSDSGVPDAGHEAPDAGPPPVEARLELEPESSAPGHLRMNWTVSGCPQVATVELLAGGARLARIGHTGQGHRAGVVA